VVSLPSVNRLSTYLPRARPRTLVSLVLLAGTLVQALLALDNDAEPLPALARSSAVAPLADREAVLRAKSQKQFPYDLWSQDDAFHAHEQAAVRTLAQRERADLGSVLSALDLHLRSHSKAHKQTASPCKPRPFYD
jgi:hypothetical protein